MPTSVIVHATLAALAEPSAADPGNGYYAVIRVLAGGVPISALEGKGGAAPFDEAELDALEAAVEAPRFGWPYRAAQVQARDRLRAVEAVYADLRATMIATWTMPLYSVPLHLRADATTDPRARKRAAAVIAAAGRRLRASPILLERMMSGILEAKAAEMTTDAKAKADVDAWYAAAKEWRERAGAAERRLGTWPLVSALREMQADGEIAYLHRLVE